MTDSVEFVPESADSADSAAEDPRLVTLRGYIQLNDLRGLFGHLNEQGYELAEVMALLDVSGSADGDALDALAEAYPAHFLGWYDWAQTDVQAALWARSRLAAVIAAQRSQSPEY